MSDAGITVTFRMRRDDFSWHITLWVADCIGGDDDMIRLHSSRMLCALHSLPSGD
jgi:hypothetical protein